MKYLDIKQSVDLGAETGAEAQTSTAALEAKLAAVEKRLNGLPADADALARADLELSAATTLVALEHGKQAWALARPAFDACVSRQDWRGAVEACDILFRSDQPGSLVALGHGVWLSVTYPVDLELTIMQLQHVVDETPDDADGAAVAAAAAVYVVELRAQGKQRRELEFLAQQMLGSVARHHSNAETQAQFDAWVQRLELGEPERFLPRLRNVINVLVQNDWWVDQEALMAELPAN